MNTITLTLCASTRTGCLSAPIHSCADERLSLAGDVTLSVGSSVALITPRGDTLAHTILSEECAPGATIPLSTLTAQAAEYTRSCRAGDTREALLALGDSEHPLALIQARIAQNPLYTLAPPTDLAPAYPTTETLKSLLAEMQAASNAAAQSATAARKSAEEAGESASSAASDRATAVNSATSAQDYAEAAQTAQGKAEAAKADAEDAKTDAASSANAAATSELKALAYKNAAEASVETAGSYRQQAIDSANKAEQLANTAATHALKAASSASKAADSATAAADSAQAAAENVTELLQGKVEAADAAKAGAEAAKTAAETAKTGAESAKAAAASSATSAANSATAAAKSATDLANAVSTAKSLDGRLEEVEAGLLGSEQVVVVEDALNEVWGEYSWFGTVAQLGVPAPLEARYTQCGIADITLTKTGYDWRDVNMLVLYYYDEAARAWKVWARSETYSSAPGSIYDNYTYVFHFVKEKAAPWLTRETKIFLAFKQNTDTTFGSAMSRLAIYGINLDFAQNGYGLCKGWPTADGEATDATNRDWCRTIGFYYVNPAGSRIDEKSKPIGSVVNRLSQIEQGRGVYKDKETKAISTFTPYAQCPDCTLKVVKTYGKFSKIMPVELDDSDTSLRLEADQNYLYFFTTNLDNKKKLWVYDYKLKRVNYYEHTNTVNTIAFLGCYYNDRLYIPQNNYDFLIRLLDKDGTILKSVVPEISGLETQPSYNTSMSSIFYNPLSGHLCMYAPQPTNKSRRALVFAFDEDLNQITEEDGTNRVFEMAMDGFYIVQPALIHGTLYLFPMNNDARNCPIFRLTAQDTLEIVRESIPKTDEEGNILYMTEEVTDDEGNVSEAYVRDAYNSNILLPQTEEGDELRYNVAISDKTNRPLLTNGWAFRVRPIVRESNVTSGNIYASISYFDGVDAYLILADGRWIDLWRLNEPFKGKPVKLRAKNDRSTAFTKKTMRVRNCGTSWSYSALPISNVLVYDAASTVPFSKYHALSVNANGTITRRDDILFDLNMGNPAEGEYNWPYRFGVIKDRSSKQCFLGVEGWVSDHNKIIYGEY